MTSRNGRPRISALQAAFSFCVLIFVLTSAPEGRAQGLDIQTSSLPSGLVGTPYSFTMAGTGGQPPYTWSATGLPSPLAINASTGQITGTPSLAGSFQVKVTLRDSASSPHNKDKNFTLVISSPLSITTVSLPNGTVNMSYAVTLAATGGRTPYSWSLASGSAPLPAGLALSTNGFLGGTPTAAGTFTFTVQVTDRDDQSSSKPLSITVVGPPPSITTASPLPAGTALSPYSQNLAVSGGNPPYTWSLSAGSLPAGLAISPGGTISGTPTTAGTANFTVQVADSLSRVATKAFALTINPPPLSITTASPLAPGTVGAPYSQNFSATGGTPPYTWLISSGTLPAGLTLSGSGVLSGTPTAAGASNFTVRVADNASQTATKAFALTINPPALSITSPTPLSAGTVGAAYSQNLSATGGTPPYRWTLVSGALPAGLTLSSDGTISGTPGTAGLADFTVQVADGASQTATKQFSITISPVPLSITTQSPLPDGTIGAPYSQNLAASGGTGPYTWSVSSGSPPAGLTLSQTGTLSGTPANAGTSNFTVQVRDSRGLTNSKAFSLTIQTSLTITTSSPLPLAVVNTSYSARIEASTSDPLTWSVTSGSPPPGLALSSSGVVSGTPTAVGAFDFTVQARRSAPVQTATKQFRLEVVSGFASFSLTNVPSAIDPAQQVPIGVSISPPQPNAITGTLTISFASNSVVPGDDPMVLFSNGTRSIDFTIPANGTSAVFTPAVSLMAGTVSGTVSFRADIRTGPIGLQVGSVVIRSTVPKLTNTTAMRTSGGIRIQVTGFSSDRTVTNAQFSFDVRTSSGTQRVDLSRSVQAEFNTWFRSAASAPFGSSFVFEQMFTVQGDATMIDAVTVGLTNGQGSGSSTAVKVSAN